MKFERIGLWLSLLANFGVLAGLMLLVVEIRHNTLTTQAVLNQENVNFIRETTALLLGGENEELASIVFRGHLDPDSLSPAELQKYVIFVSIQMVAWETAFMNFDQGLIGERIWRGTDRAFSSMVQQGPGYRRWWEATRDGYDRAFQEHVNQVFERGT
jgi:hypothetical protein